MRTMFLAIQILLSVQVANAGERVLVFDVVGDAPESELALLSRVLRTGVVQSVGSSLEVVNPPTASADKSTGSSETYCALDTTCVAKQARAADANLALVSILQTLGGGLILSAEVRDVSSGSVRAASVVQGASSAAIMDQLGRMAGELGSGLAPGQDRPSTPGQDRPKERDPSRADEGLRVAVTKLQEKVDALSESATVTQFQQAMEAVDTANAEVQSAYNTFLPKQVTLENTVLGLIQLGHRANAIALAKLTELGWCVEGLGGLASCEDRRLADRLVQSKWDVAVGTWEEAVSEARAADLPALFRLAEENRRRSVRMQSAAEYYINAHPSRTEFCPIATRPVTVRVKQQHILLDKKRYQYHPYHYDRLEACGFHRTLAVLQRMEGELEAMRARDNPFESYRRPVEAIEAALRADLDTMYP